MTINNRFLKSHNKLSERPYRLLLLLRIENCCVYLLTGAAKSWTIHLSEQISFGNKIIRMQVVD